MEQFKLVAKTFAGLEPVLANEIKKLGGQNVQLGRRAVFYEGDLEIIYKSNYYLRTALRILKEIETFQFKNADQFYLKCKNVNWIKYFDVNQSFVVNSNVFNSKEFRNSMFTSLKVKDAIADYFREKLGKRPDVDITNADIIINAHIVQNNCVLSIDSSGESLHKRGYRVKQGDAPLNEVLAAGMILLSGWNGNMDFVDPMCGSGTLPIEAAFIAMNIPAGKFRKDYTFMSWNDFDNNLFETSKKWIKKEFKNKIYASDISGDNLLNAITNARRAQVFNKINFQKADFRDLILPINNATIIINPPYGERIKSDNISRLYSMIGERLKHQYPNNTAWILSASSPGIKNIGLKPSIKKELYNGELLCKYYNYHLFTGKLTQQK